VPNMRRLATFPIGGVTMGGRGMAGAVVSCPPAILPIFRPPRVSVCERQPSLERLANGWLITLLPVAFARVRQSAANTKTR
jgi:hypothetical protein